MIWYRYKVNIVYINLMFITSPVFGAKKQNQVSWKTHCFEMIWVRYKGEIYILDFTFTTDPNKKFKEQYQQFFTFQNWVHF